MNEPLKEPAIAYRPDIDGLRAIAVVAVIVFHAKISLNGHPILPGGYLGVDVFFVISGFLITSIISREIQKNRFSLLDFYSRRARRILPALFLVFTLSLPFAFYSLLPKQFEEFSHSIASSIAFVSNYFFLTKLGYYDQASELRPFLHTWSLSIEEQFYLIFPVLMLFLVRYESE